MVEAARDAFGIEVVVLRMLDSELPRPHGGRVTYLAETAARLPPAAAAALVPWAGTLDEQPLRLSWAVPGGPDADLAWAEDVLRRRGIERRGPAVQVRSWNLSSIWRLPLADAGPAWLKVVPPFFGHEGDVLRRLQAGPVPRLLGHDGPRILLADIEGEDQYDAPLPVLERMVDLLVELQAAWFGRDEELLAMRLPDWRGPALTAAIAAVVERRRGELDAAVAATLDAFVAGLGERFAAVEACGMPDTLVHGDFHPGNVRGTPVPAHPPRLGRHRRRPAAAGPAGVPRRDPGGGRRPGPRPLDRRVAGTAARGRPGARGVAPRAGRGRPPGRDLPAVRGRDRARGAAPSRRGRARVARAVRRARRG